jgi:hypothetical protein
MRHGPEQGRDQHPSPQVIDAVARALQLDEDATAYLHVLAQPDAAARRVSQLERALPSIAQLIASWPGTPAFVQNRHMDVLAANALASAVSPFFSPGVNLVRATFLDPEVRRLSGDWESAARTAVGRLRALAGPDVDDPGWSSSWASCRSAATSSGACGPAMTSRSRRFPPALSTIRSWARLSCRPSGWRSPAPKGSSWSSITLPPAVHPSRR